MVISVIFKPTNHHLKEIELWLIQEYENTGKGFYCNWNIISKSFIEKKIAIITENGISVGFAVYGIYGFVSHIDLLEIKPSHRKKGLGKNIIDELFKYLKDNGSLVASVFCKPENSEVFWKAIGFSNTPKLRHNNKSVYLYKSIIDTLKLGNTNKCDDEIIELWDLEPYQTKEIKSKWQWIIKYKPNSRMLENPIIFPIDSDWQIQWKKGKTIIETDKIKYFKNKIYFAGFMIIKELIK